MLLQSKQFYKTLINSQIKWNGSVYTAQILCPMFIGLLNVITWVYKSSSYFRVFWLSLLENNRKKYQYWLSLSVRYVSTVLNLYPFCRESWRKVSRASWPSILLNGLNIKYIIIYNFQNLYSNKPRNSGIGRRLLDSSYDFKY